MDRKREVWAMALAAVVIALSIGFLWVSRSQPTAPTIVEETNVDVDAPEHVTETPPSATGDLSTSSSD
ncbi:hypothetical protein PZ897_14485 [Hoeflea sp. YIM 152468]|uniref:hypothetical protein n=1 Tax=Hoeflea sp. YIM 152468 TaxID=3031759 RepID=UPI0023DAA90B|nr:hypothetical protein [Hoeflea sp. YIM 152468]MDF1609389.1 hypothetical protein [Hoeflea sp. YIM 152468]